MESQTAPSMGPVAFADIELGTYVVLTASTVPAYIDTSLYLEGLDCY